MTTLRRVLLMLVAAELIGVAAVVGWHWSHPLAPAPDLARLAKSTAEDLERLQVFAQEGRPNAWRDLGEAYLAFGYFVEAEACLRHAAGLDENDFLVEYAWACSLDRMGRTQEAQPHFEAAATLADRDMVPHCLYQVGRNHLREENAAAAETAFRRIDTFPPADHQLARLFVSLGRDAEARPLIGRLEAAFPRDLSVQMLALRADRYAARRASAAEHLDRSERSLPLIELNDHLHYLHGIRSRYGLPAALGRIEMANARNQLSEAASQFEAVVQGTDMELLLDKLIAGIELELRAGRPREAQQMLERLGERMALHPSALHLLGDAWFALGEREKAREAWQRANRLRPRSDSHARLADYLDQDGDSAGANHERGLAHLEAGVRAYRRDQLEPALEHLNDAVKLAPHEPRGWFYLGEVRRLLSQSDAAREAYQQCIALSPNHGRALARLASLNETPSKG